MLSGHVLILDYLLGLFEILTSLERTNEVHKTTDGLMHIIFWFCPVFWWLHMDMCLIFLLLFLDQVMIFITSSSAHILLHTVYSQILIICIVCYSVSLTVFCCLCSQWMQSWGMFPCDFIALQLLVLIKWPRAVEMWGWYLVWSLPLVICHLLSL
jgi:hypothetical protein